jgi:hypothetical protein
MIHPDKFYKPDELPDKRTQQRLWRGIEKQIRRTRPILAFVRDARSFAYGIAATVLLYLSAVGAITIVKDSIENAQPAVVQVDQAYQSAIKAFEQIMPQLVSSPRAEPENGGELLARKDQIHMIDKAIEELRQETRNNDLSPMKRTRLRQLYSIKLQILIDMIDNGEIEL